MPTIKVQSEFVAALAKHDAIFTALGRAAALVRCRLVCCTHCAPEEGGKKNSTGLEKKGVAPGAAHSKGSPTEARNADAGPDHMT